MARYAMIDGYLDTMRTEIRWRRDLDDVVGEIEDHLYSTVEGMLATGLESDTAQRATLDRFGEPRYLAALYASTTSGGIAVPTTTTTRAGTLALFAAASWLVMVPFFVYGLAKDNTYDDPWIGVYLLWALTVGVAGVLGLFVMIALGKRHGGFGVPGMIAIGFAGVGIAMSVIVTWAGPLWMGLLGVGYLITGVLMFSRGLAPKLGTFLFSIGMLAGVAAFVIADAAEWGSPDSYGDYPNAFGIGQVVGQGITALGLIGLGLWLKREEPVEIGEAPIAA